MKSQRQIALRHNISPPEECIAISVLSLSTTLCVSVRLLTSPSLDGSNLPVIKENSGSLSSLLSCCSVETLYSPPNRYYTIKR